MARKYEERYKHLPRTIFACFSVEPVIAVYENNCVQTVTKQHVENTERLQNLKE